jgi:transposase-like protein
VNLPRINYLENVMKLEALKCPSCSADLTLHRDVQFCRCDHCGTQYAIHWTEQDGYTLTQFQTLSAQVASDMDVLKADMRLRYIENDIARTSRNASHKQLELELASRDRRQVLHRLERRADTWMTGLIATIVGLVAAVVVFFLLDGLGRLLVAAAAVIAGLLLWCAIVGLQKTKSEARTEEHKTRERIAEAQRALTAAELEHRSFLLEQELCQHRVQGFRYAVKQP